MGWDKADKGGKWTREKKKKDLLLLTKLDMLLAQSVPILRKHGVKEDIKPHLWTLTVGSDEQLYFSQALKHKPDLHDEEKQKSESKKTNRIISGFLQGLINIIADLLCGKGISWHNLDPQSSFAVNTSWMLLILSPLSTFLPCPPCLTLAKI